MMAASMNYTDKRCKTAELYKPPSFISLQMSILNLFLLCSGIIANAQF